MVGRFYVEPPESLVRAVWEPSMDFTRDRMLLYLEVDGSWDAREALRCGDDQSNSHTDVDGMRMNCSRLRLGYLEACSRL